MMNTTFNKNTKVSPLMSEMKKSTANARAAYNAALMLQNKGSRMNAQIFMEKAAMGGYIPAMIELAKSLMQGEYSVTDADTESTYQIKDAVKAAKWLELAAGKDPAGHRDPIACYLFSRCLCDGVGVAKDHGRSQYYLDFVPGNGAAMAVYRSEEVLCFGDFKPAKRSACKTA